ncbi:MAG: putative peptidoglycan glycosyltransferase FtsW [Pseudomonadota bacterium]
MTDMVHGPVALAPGEPVLPRWWRTVDKWSLAAALGLFAIGLLLGLAASVPLAVRNGLSDFHYVSRQAVFGVLAFSVLTWLSMQPLKELRRLAVLGFAAAAIAVLLLPVFGTDFEKGATRWYSLGFMSVQPSEFLKPGFVVFTAWLMAASFEVNGPPGRLLSFLTAVFFTLVLCLQPDFGQASLILGAWGLMYFVAGANLFLLIALAGMVMAAGLVAYSNSEHVARRIDGYLNPDVDPTTQLGYATNAIQEGGFLGVGVGEGTVKWALPDAHTDFIIAVAAEEYGLLLCLLIIGLYLVIAMRSLFRLIKERDPFVRLAGTGLAGLVALQAFINMGVAVRLLPAKGMTLPFISYGGSSLVAAGITLGLLLALTRTRPQAGLGDVIGRVR